MYVILVDDNNRLVETVKARIMQRSKLVDDLWFLVKPTYNGLDMGRFTVSLEYVAPASRKYRHEILELSSDLYNGYYKYKLPVDTKITAEAGEVELLLTFLMADLDVNGMPVQRVRKADGAKITIHPVTAWSDIIPDEALTALDQRIIKTDAQIRALADMGEILNLTKADGLDYNETENEIQLTANGMPIGNRVALANGEASLKDGVPVVDFSKHSFITPDENEPEDEDDDNVVEF